jgi:hypothetical protein
MDGRSIQAYTGRTPRRRESRVWTSRPISMSRPSRTLDPPGRVSGPRGRLSMALHDRWVRLALTTLVVVGVLACLLGQLFPDALRRASAVFFPPARTATPMAPSMTSTPLPATGFLALPPTDCPASPPLDSIIAQAGNFSVQTKMYGRSPRLGSRRIASRHALYKRARYASALS